MQIELMKMIISDFMVKERNVCTKSDQKVSSSPNIDIKLHFRLYFKKSFFPSLSSFSSFLEKLRKNGWLLRNCNIISNFLTKIKVDFFIIFNSSFKYKYQKIK